MARHVCFWCHIVMANTVDNVDADGALLCIAVCIDMCNKPDWTRTRVHTDMRARVYTCMHGYKPQGHGVRRVLIVPVRMGACSPWIHGYPIRQNAHARMHARTHARTHTHARARAHTHTLVRVCVGGGTLDKDELRLALKEVPWTWILSGMPLPPPFHAPSPIPTMRPSLHAALRSLPMRTGPSDKAGAPP